MGDSSRGAAAPLLTPAGAVLALILALALGWPMLATGGYLTLEDTPNYIRGGKIIWDMATGLVGMGEASSAVPHDGGGSGGQAAASNAAMPIEGLVNEDGEPYTLRSFPYSLYTFFAGASLWPAGFALLQTAAVIWSLFALIGPDATARHLILAATFVYLATLTTLPWFASYLMPDILGAALVIHAAVLLRKFDELGPWQRTALVAIAVFAVAAHYGHLPLAAGLLGVVLAWRAVRGRLTKAVVVAAILPLLAAPLANITASTVALDGPSVTPLRLPILLARSIDDGPARWYLEEACPEADLAFCEAFGDEVPPTLPAFLWDDSGINSLSPDQLADIRAEEFEVIKRAFFAYPVAQTRSLVGNSVRQVFRVGTGQIDVSRWIGGYQFRLLRTERAEKVLGVFDRITPIGTWAGALALFALWLGGRLDGPLREAAAVVVLGLLLNAAIFGGLSAPVDRYQARIVWLLPALAGIGLAAWRGRQVPGEV